LLPKEADAEQKLEILNWISAVIGEPIDTKEPFEKVLKDGVILCKYAITNISYLTIMFAVVYHLRDLYSHRLMLQLQVQETSRPKSFVRFLETKQCPYYTPEQSLRKLTIFLEFSCFISFFSFSLITTCQAVW